MSSAYNELLTMHMAPQDVLLNLSVDFTNNLTSDEVETIISELECKIKDRFLLGAGVKKYKCTHERITLLKINF